VLRLLAQLLQLVHGGAEGGCGGGTLCGPGISLPPSPAAACGYALEVPRPALALHQGDHSQV
jgi:hypothetical protein